MLCPFKIYKEYALDRSPQESHDPESNHAESGNDPPVNTVFPKTEPMNQCGQENQDWPGQHRDYRTHQTNQHDQQGDHQTQDFFPCHEVIRKQWTKVESIENAAKSNPTPHWTWLGRVFKMLLPICWPKRAGASLLLGRVFRRNIHQLCAF